MRTIMLSLSVFLSVFSLFGCGARTRSTSTSQATYTPAHIPTSTPKPTGNQIPTSQSTISPTYKSTATPTDPFIATPTDTKTPYPVVPVVSEWDTYTASGVSIQYPANWQVHTINSPEYVNFRLDEAVDVSQFYSIMLEIYDRPVEQRKIDDPHAWQPNEGGYEIHWEQPILIHTIPGIEFIWGARRGDEWDSRPTLMAVLYSEPDQLDIRLSTGFDGNTMNLETADGIRKVIQEKYSVFEHMLQSIKINR